MTSVGKGIVSSETPFMTRPIWLLQVRRLICACLVQVYSVGDSLPLYSRVASLQSFLGSKVGAHLFSQASQTFFFVCQYLGYLPEPVARRACQNSGRTMLYRFKPAAEEASGHRASLGSGCCIAGGIEPRLARGCQVRRAAGTGGPIRCAWEVAGV